MVLRFVHAPNVATANEGPNTVAIGSHNEYGLSSHFPSYAFFFCVSQPAKGGETPIASSLEIYDKLAARSPEFVQALRDRGLRFSIHHQRDVIEGNLQYVIASVCCRLPCMRILAPKWDVDSQTMLTVDGFWLLVLATGATRC